MARANPIRVVEYEVSDFGYPIRVEHVFCSTCRVELAEVVGDGGELVRIHSDCPHFTWSWIGADCYAGSDDEICEGTEAELSRAVLVLEDGGVVHTLFRRH